MKKSLFFHYVGNRDCGIVLIFTEMLISVFVYTSFKEIQNSIVG